MKTEIDGVAARVKDTPKISSLRGEFASGRNALTDLISRFSPCPRDATVLLSTRELKPLSLSLTERLATTEGQ